MIRTLKVSVFLFLLPLHLSTIPCFSEPAASVSYNHLFIVSIPDEPQPNWDGKGEIKYPDEKIQDIKDSLKYNTLDILSSSNATYDNITSSLQKGDITYIYFHGHSKKDTLSVYFKPPDYSIYSSDIKGKTINPSKFVFIDSDYSSTFSNSFKEEQFFGWKRDIPTDNFGSIYKGKFLPYESFVYYQFTSKFLNLIKDKNTIRLSRNKAVESITFIPNLSNLYPNLPSYIGSDSNNLYIYRLLSNTFLWGDIDYTLNE